MTVISGFHAVEVDAAGDCASLSVLSIPDNVMVASVFDFIYQGFHQLALEVVDFYSYRSSFFEAVIDGCGGVEGIGEIALQLCNHSDHAIIVGDRLGSSGEAEDDDGIFRIVCIYKQISCGASGLGGGISYVKLHEASGLDDEIYAFHLISTAIYDMEGGSGMHGADEYGITVVIDGDRHLSGIAKQDGAKIDVFGFHHDHGSAGDFASDGQNNIINPSAILSLGGGVVFAVFPFEAVVASLGGIGHLLPDVLGARPLVFEGAIDIDFEEVVVRYAGYFFPEEVGTLDGPFK